MVNWVGVLKVEWNFRCLEHGEKPPGLEDFIVRNDHHLYGQKTGFAALIDQAEIKLVSHGSSKQELHTALDKLDLANDQRLRPSWDQYFMQLASLAAQRSNCMKRRVGCVLVRERRVISTGYNGTPRNLKNCNEGGCQYHPSGKRPKESEAELRRCKMQQWPESRHEPCYMSMSPCRRECSSRSRS